MAKYPVIEFERGPMAPSGAGDSRRYSLVWAEKSWRGVLVETNRRWGAWVVDADDEPVWGRTFRTRAAALFHLDKWLLEQV